MIVMQCPGCKTRFEFADELAGKKIRCKSCGDIFRVDTAAPKTAPPPKPAAASNSVPPPKPAAPKPAPKPVVAASRPAVVEDDRPPVKSRSRDEDDDRPPVRSRSRDEDDDDRPPVKSRSRDDEDDRPPVRSRSRDDDEDDRPTVKSRRRDEDDDEPPMAVFRRGRADDDREDDEDDDRDRRRYDDSEDELPRRKRVNPLLIIGPILAVVLIGAVVVFLATRGKKKGSDGDGEVAKGVSKIITLDVPAKDIDRLVVPDGGNQFGLLRNESAEFFRKKWVYEPYDLAAGRRVGRIDLPEVKEPVAVTVSPDGKYLLLTEKGGFADRDKSLVLYSIATGKCLTQGKWVPFPPNEKRPFDTPSLFKAEFLGNDRIVTVGTNQTYHIYKVPTYDVEKSDAVRVTGKPLGETFGPAPKDREQLDWQVAFSANRSRWAVWNGEGYSVLDADGVEQFRTPSVMQMASAMWQRDVGDRLRAGGVSFSPDGKTLAGFVINWPEKERILCLWDANTSQLPETTRLPAGQHNEAAGLKWWGNRYVVLTGMNADGREVEPAAFDTTKGLLMKQLMTPEYRKAAFGRDGRLWYAVSDDRTDPARLVVMDPPDPSMMEEGGGQYEEIPDLRGAFLKRLWMEPTGVLKKPTRYNATIKSGLIRQP